jgi:hypothetical protein
MKLKLPLVAIAATGEGSSTSLARAALDSIWSMVLVVAGVVQAENELAPN